jgi:hypothetical protein
MFWWSNGLAFWVLVIITNKQLNVYDFIRCFVGGARVLDKFRSLMEVYGFGFT